MTTTKSSPARTTPEELQAELVFQPSPQVSLGVELELQILDRETAELAIIEAYLPAQLSPDEVRALVAQVIAATGASGPKDMGKVMGQVMPHLKGRFPGQAVRPIVQEMLAGKD